MIDQNAPIWNELHSAGNDADKWLRHLLEGDEDFQENMEILAEDLSHQLSYYSATAYVLPHLAALCPRLSLEKKLFLIAQMGAAVAAESEWPLSPDTEAYREFQEGLEGLRRETKSLIADPHIAALLKDAPELRLRSVSPVGLLLGRGTCRLRLRLERRAASAHRTARLSKADRD